MARNRDALTPPLGTLGAPLPPCPRRERSRRNRGCRGCAGGGVPDWRRGAGRRRGGRGRGHVRPLVCPQRVFAARRAGQGGESGAAGGGTGDAGGGAHGSRQPVRPGEVLLGVPGCGREGADRRRPALRRWRCGWHICRGHGGRRPASLHRPRRLGGRLPQPSAPGVQRLHRSRRGERCRGRRERPWPRHPRGHLRQRRRAARPARPAQRRGRGAAQPRRRGEASRPLANGLRRPAVFGAVAHRPPRRGALRGGLRGVRRRAGRARRRQQRRAVSAPGRFRGARNAGVHSGRPRAERPAPGTALQRAAVPALGGGNARSVRRSARGHRQLGGGGQALQLRHAARHLLPAELPPSPRASPSNRC